MSINKLESLPKWLLLLGSFLLVLLVGYVDYRTGDYSILIFYIPPVSLAAWYSGRWSGVAIAAASGCARFLSDAVLYSGSQLEHWNPHLHSWNSIEETLFLVIVGVLVTSLRTALEK